MVEEEDNCEEDDPSDLGQGCIFVEENFIDNYSSKSGIDDEGPDFSNEEDLTQVLIMRLFVFILKKQMDKKLFDNGIFNFGSQFR